MSLPLVGLPSFLATILSFLVSRHKIDVKSSCYISETRTDYDRPHTNTKFTKRALSISGLLHWNSLPETTCATTDRSKRTWTYYFLKSFLFSFYLVVFIFYILDICNAWLVRLVYARHNTVILVGPTVFRGLRNFEPSCGIYLFPCNFVEFDKTTCD